MTPPHVDRMITEGGELAEKAQKLTTFMEGPAFSDLDKVDQQLLQAQYASMAAYLTILNMRIARAKGAN